MNTLITGKSGSGKTTILKLSGIKNIYYADDYVKDILYKEGTEVFDWIKSKYHDCISNGSVDTISLGKILFNDMNKLNEVNIMIFPFIEKWIKSLPKDSIIEMATYINLEKMYKHFFGRIILITRKNPDLTKFAHINNGYQPIKSIKISYDYEIKNDGDINEAVIKLKNILA